MDNKRYNLLKKVKELGITHIEGKKNLTNMTCEELEQLINWFKNRNMKGDK